MTRRRRLRHILVAVLVVALAAALNFPVREWTESTLKKDLSEAGIEGRFRVSDVGLHSITLQEVQVAGQTLEALTLGYSPLEIMQGNFRTLNASHMALKQGAVSVALEAVDLNILPDAQKQRWAGPWKVQDIRLEGLPVEVPVLTGEGTLAREEDDIVLEGTIASKDRKFMAQFALDYPLQAKDRAVLTLKEVHMPWNGGVMSVGKVAVPLFGAAPVTFTLALKKVALDMLLEGVTGKKATATGTISGHVPVTVARDGNFSVGAGSFAADGNGVLTLSPEAIPGDNAQVALVRQVLQDFHYHDFSLAVEQGKGQKLGLLMALKGNNPAVYDGRPVNLNVHLAGDVLGLLSQSMTMLQHPEDYLRQENHEKH